MSPSPVTFHQIIIGRIHLSLARFLERRSLGIALIAPMDVFLSETNVYQPDVIFISSERRNIITEKGIEGAPDLVVEVLSPSTARYDKGSKLKIYARTGVKEMWLVDPEAKNIQIFRLDENAEIPAATRGDNAFLSSSLLPGWKLKTSTIFKPW